MKSILKTSCFNKSLLFLLFTIVISNFANAQKRLPQNIRRVTVTNQYEIINGKPTDKFRPIYQELFDSLGRLHTEISFDFLDHYPHNYIWHTFIGKQKVKTEIFKNEKLQTIEEFIYNADSLLIKKTLKKVNPSDTSIFLVLYYKYDSKKNPIEITAKSDNGKIAYTSKSTYNDKGKELTRIVKVKKNVFPEDSIVKLISTPKYDSIGRLIGELNIISKADKSTIQKKLKYSYDKKNNQIGVLELDATDKQILRQEKAYNYSRNRLSLVKYYNSKDILFKMIEKRYEIYRTNERKVREIDY